MVSTNDYAPATVTEHATLHECSLTTHSQLAVSQYPWPLLLKLTFFSCSSFSALPPRLPVSAPSCLACSNASTHVSRSCLPPASTLNVSTRSGNLTCGATSSTQYDFRQFVQLARIARKKVLQFYSIQQYECRTWNLSSPSAFTHFISRTANTLPASRSCCVAAYTSVCPVSSTHLLLYLGPFMQKTSSGIQ